MVTTEDQLLNLCQTLKTQTEIAVDTEVSTDDDNDDEDDL